MQVIRPVADTTRQARLLQIAQGPWVFADEEALPGGEVTFLRAGGKTGYRGQVELAFWSLPDVQRAALPGHVAFQSRWPGRRGVVVAASYQDGAGEWHTASTTDVFLLAAVWERRDNGNRVGVVVDGGQAINVRVALLWHWLHWPLEDALPALV